MVYKIEDPDYAPESRRHFNVLNGTQTVAWLIAGEPYAPIVYIHVESHKVDRLELAKTIAEKWPDTEGAYFLVTEYVTIEDLQAKLNSNDAIKKTQ